MTAVELISSDIYKPGTVARGRATAMATAGSSGLVGSQALRPSAAVWTIARDPSDLHEKAKELQCQDLAGDGSGDPTGWKVSFGRFTLFPSRRLLTENGEPVRIGSRALDLLIALVGRPGELHTKRELMATVWPHIVVGESNLKVHILGLRRVLADGHAGNRYISTVPGRGYCFVMPVVRSAGPAVVNDPAATRSINVSPPRTRLIGRDEEVSRVSMQLGQHRFVTLVGPGGIGKSAVAIATAGASTGNYEHGVYFTDLSALSDPQTLPTEVGSAIRDSIPGDNPSAGLLSFLRDKRMLLVFDSCEHIVEAVAALVSRVLCAAPDVHILATSREPLGIEGERIYHLRPLEIPGELPVLGCNEALNVPAVRLFAERAAEALGDFRLRDVNTSAVVEICRKLEGIPLAIEIAAANIDAFGPQGILARLNHPLGLPAARRRMAPPRHRTLRATLDWSYGLLTESEKKTLRRLAALTGSFTMNEAVAAAGGHSDSDCDATDQVVSLIAKSLVAADTDGSETRLRLLATTRAYALERCEENGEPDAMPQAHVQVYQCSALELAF